MVRKQAYVALTFVLAMFAAHAQTSQPTVTFKLDFPGSEPDHYVISVSNDGHAHYESSGKLSPQSDSNDAFQTDFTVTPDFRSHIFDLAKRAHYFSGQVDSMKKGIASTGAKTLVYTDGTKSTEASYNYSTNASVQQLTSLFQDLSTTLEFGHRLDYYYRYQKLALADELKRMEDMDNSNGLEQVSAVAPILQKIASDQSVLNVVRARAERLLLKSSDGAGRP
jgi:hypothetical protein